MSNSDFSLPPVGPVNLNANATSLQVKPTYLIKLTKLNKKTKTHKLFIAIEKTNEGSFIKVKGFYREGTEKDIIKDYREIILSIPKTEITEVEFPISIIYSIQNLIFKAK